MSATKQPPLAPVLSGRGEGGVCSLSEKEGRKDLPSVLPSEPAGEPTLADVLLAVGIYALSREKRQALADELAAEIVTGHDVQSLRAYLVSCLGDDAKLQRTFAAKLIEPRGRVEMFADLRRHMAARAKEAPKGSDHDYGEAIRMENKRRVQSFDSEFERWVAAKARGEAQAVERLRMPWEAQA